MILQIDGIQAHVETLGARGSQLLLLHGWGPSSVSLEKHLLPLGHALKHGHHITMVDFPGHGSSGQPPGSWGVPQYAQWLLRLMDELALRRIDIIAHSFGGRVALYLAAKHPERVMRMVLTGCAGIRPKRGLQGRLRGTLFKVGKGAADALARVPAFKPNMEKMKDALRKETASADYLATPEAHRGSFSRIVTDNLRPLLSLIDQPTLLVWGEDDTATPLWMGRVMQRELKQATLLIYEKDDHFAYLNQLARFANAADAFLERGQQT